MKALSIRQPWAWLIVNGIKTVENRSWATKFCGRFLVHASSTFYFNKWDYEPFRMDIQALLDANPNFNHLHLPMTTKGYEQGGIVGAVDLVDCVTKCTNKIDASWHEPDYYAFILRNPEVLPFRQMNGKLNFFEVP